MKPQMLRLLVAVTLLVCAREGYAWQNDQQPAAPAPSPDGTATLPPVPDSQHTPPSRAPKPQFFAGTVTQLDRQHITVSRTLVGKAPESRTFLIQKGTKLSRAVRPKLRVTVRYQHLPEGDVALEVQIRQSRAPRSS